MRDVRPDAYPAKEKPDTSGVGPFSRAEASQFPEGAVARSADDDVVEDLDLEELSGADQVAGGAEVRFARGGVARGVVVQEHDGVRGGDDGGAEHLA